MPSKPRNRKAADARVKTTAEVQRDAPTAFELSRRGGRETVDALVIAFVWAFLIRTFVAEMFVIPTGSMAPTLMGRHKDVFCEESGLRFRVNSSDDRQTYATQLKEEVVRRRRAPMTAQELRRELPAVDCVAGVSPQARHTMLLGDPPRGVANGQAPTQTANYSGDRLLVSKYAYSFTDPERWDVVVFKYPGNSLTNYIKRVTGLPGESLRIFQGDLFVKPLDAGEDDYRIARKPPEQVLAMRQRVHDTHHEPAKLIDAGWPLGWAPEGDQAESAWSVERGELVASNGASVYQPRYRGDAPADETRWLRYEHRPPGEPVWDRVLGRVAGEPDLEGSTPPPSLVTDFTPYNTRINRRDAAAKGRLTIEPRQAPDLGRLGVHWVSDLMVEADVRIESTAGELSLDLVEAGDHFGVSIDLATGEATFWRQAFETEDREALGSIATTVRGGGSHRIALANIDNLLLLWVDGEVFDADATHRGADADALGEAQAPRTSELDAGDLAPAGVGLRDAVATVDRLRVWRDGYYIATRWDRPSVGFATDYDLDALDPADRAAWPDAIVAVAEDPELWPVLASRQKADFDIDEGQLFVLGDNSGWSLDARLWRGGNGRGSGRPGGPYLERTQLVGKAICVYWPHAWYSLPLTNRLIPAWPNFADMRLVR